jgi:acyl dehydratase
MAVPSSLVGLSTAPFVHEVDARWLMAYAAGLGDYNPCYLDTLAPAGIVGHPLFPVCPEWPVVLAVRDLAAERGVPLDELRRGVHATHDLHIHRPVRADEQLTTVGHVEAVETRKPGAYVLMRLETAGAAGEPVCTTWQASLYLGVAVDGPDQGAGTAPTLPEPPNGVDTPWMEHERPVSAGAAHIYTECARIWNPIHTDPVAAEQAGLPEIILHGTATHALGVTRVVDVYAGGDPTLVRRVTGRFGGMVLMPSSVVIATRDVGDGVIQLSVRSATGAPAVRDGFVVLGDRSGT